MTIQELYDSVAQLGFETSLEDTERFIFAVNRAIIQINRIRPQTAIYRLNHFPINNLLSGTARPFCKDESAEFEAINAKSYYFECNGNGTAYIEKNEDGVWNEDAPLKTITLTSPNKAFVTYRGLVLDGNERYAGKIRLRFTGDYLYYIQNIALYSSLLSDSVSDIPSYGKYCRYDIKTLTNDFLSFVCPPIVGAIRDEKFALNQDYFVEGESILLIPASIHGVFDIKYDKKIDNITSANMQTTLVPLDDELAALLPLLVASYVLADDEPEKSEYYYSRYAEQVAVIERKRKNLAPVKYRHNRW